MTSDDSLSRGKREAQRLRHEYGDLFDQLVAILFCHDPVSINFETNSDEYEPEARTILPRLKEARSPDDTVRIVREELERWFGPDCGINDDQCRRAAEEIWQMWSQRSE
jgi:hypothetical protein